MAHVKIDELTKAYGSLKVFADLNINIEHGEFIALLGPSGCGKSTLLRCIAGLEDVTNGDILYDGKSIVDIPPSNRGAAMVFQSYALYPHKTVAENMGFALKIAKVERGEIDRRVREAADILNIVPLLEKRPRELSGGQRQRVAIGRAIVRKPEVFLFDEPLSNLDAELRAKMRVELLRLHKQIDATMIYVTHDQIEAMTMADQIVILHDGRIRQIGPPQEVFDAPADLFVARFIGTPAMNIFAINDYPDLKAVLHQEHGPSTDAVTTVGIRPDDFVVKSIGAATAQIMVQIEVTESLGRQKLLHGKTRQGDEITLSVQGAVPVEPGRETPMFVDPNAIHLFDADGRRVSSERSRNVA